MDRFGQLLIDPPLDPATNMAVDWWLLKTVDEPTVRFYRWDRPTISLGYRQQKNPPDAVTNTRNDFSFVVRPTGGGYLYHHRDLSYSIVLPSDHELTDAGILESYERIRDGFYEALEDLGLAEERRTGSGSQAPENCLSDPACHEPTLEGAKWMAASQMRHRKRFLQHGSLFWRDSDWPEDFDSEEPFHLHRAAGGVNSEDLRSAVVRELVDLLGFETVCGNEFRGTRDWDDITNLAETFRFETFDELPVFDQFSDNTALVVE